MKRTIILCNLLLLMLFPSLYAFSTRSLQQRVRELHGQEEPGKPSQKYFSYAPRLIRPPKQEEMPTKISAEERNEAYRAYNPMIDTITKTLGAKVTQWLDVNVMTIEQKQYVDNVLSQLLKALRYDAYSINRVTDKQGMPAIHKKIDEMKSKIKNGLGTMFSSLHGFVNIPEFIATYRSTKDFKQLFNGFLAELDEAQRKLLQKRWNMPLLAKDLRYIRSIFVSAE